jgi:putative two-component system response regulator
MIMNAKEAEEKATILVVEDDAEMAWMISDLLEREGYSAVLAQSGEEALDLLAPAEPLVRSDLILLDVVMEGLDGYQVCQRVKRDERLGYIPIIMVTVLDSLSEKVRGLECGADDYVTKPFKGEDLLARIGALLRVKRLYDGLKQAEKELRESCAQLRKTLDETVYALATTAEKRDPFAVGHQQRVTRLACAIAEEMGLSAEQIDGIHMAGLIHDIGKTSVPVQVLVKPTPLSDLEHGLMKVHAQVGHDILKAIEFPWPVAEIVLQHHERLDGSGYPRGLAGDDILLEARILAVANLVDVMTSRQAQRLALSMDEALEEITQNRGVLYDPEVVDACLKLFSEKGFTLK